MKTYFDNYELYVTNDDSLIYVVNSFDCYDNHPYISIHLQLVAGWDYLNEDSDTHGWCPANRFIEDIQTDYINQYFLVESMKESLEENGYTVLDELPSSIDWINK